MGEVVSERNILRSKGAGYPLVSFTVKDGVTPKTERYDREQLVIGDTSKKLYKETRLDDIVYNPANLKFGAIARNKYGNAVFSPIYITLEACPSVVSPAFVEMLVTRRDFINRALKYQQGTVYERMAVSVEDLVKMNIRVPSLPEQRRIGGFFSTLDSLIAAAERQEALLKQKKQAYLQLMFPREGETEPQLRLAGFSGEWEMRRFGEIFQYERPDAYLAGDDEIEDEGAIPVLTANKAFILGYTNSLQGIYQKGRCIIFDDFTLDSKRVEQPFKVRSSAIKILTVRENMDFDFAFELLRTSKFPVLGHARHYITVVQPQATLIPHFLQEQQRIGRFFRNFDSLIAAAEKRAASLRALKSAYLQRMFV